MVAIFLMALAPRLALIPWFRRLPLLGDESYYWEQSARPFFEYQFRPPLWAFVLKAARFISDDPFSGRLLAVSLGALTVVLVFLLARRLFGASVGWTAAAMISLYPDHVFWSHFLWSESLFTVTILLSCLFFFPRHREDSPSLLSAALPAGISLMAKEFAVIVFAAMAVAHIFSRTERKVRTLCLASLLFAAPMTFYVGALVLKTGEFHLPWNAMVANARDKTQSGAPGSTGLQAMDQKSLMGNFERLWGARSFVLWRVGSGDYGRSSRSLLWGMLIAHAALFILGGFGLVWEHRSTFAVFAWTCVLCLSLAAVPGFMVSRFRTPFMFIFIIEAARVVALPSVIPAALRSPVRSVLASTVIAGVIFLFATTVGVMGRWG